MNRFTLATALLVAAAYLVLLAPDDDDQEDVAITQLRALDQRVSALEGDRS